MVTSMSDDPDPLPPATATMSDVARAPASASRRSRGSSTASPTSVAAPPRGSAAANDSSTDATSSGQPAARRRPLADARPLARQRGEPVRAAGPSRGRRRRHRVRVRGARGEPGGATPSGAEGVHGARPATRWTASSSCLCATTSPTCACTRSTAARRSCASTGRRRASRRDCVVGDNEGGARDAVGTSSRSATGASRSSATASCPSQTARLRREGSCRRRRAGSRGPRDDRAGLHRRDAPPPPSSHDAPLGPTRPRRSSPART